MASLQIRDMPQDLYESLKLSAERERRSLAQQAIKLLISALSGIEIKKIRRMEALKRLRTSPLSQKAKKKLDPIKLIREDRER